MQNELRAENPDLPIQIIGINEFGQESGNPLMTEGRTTPLLQDVDADNNGSSDVWYDSWEITYRDVKILNQQNEIVGTVNLTTPAGYDLSEQINYDALKKIITDVAHERPFWQNPDDPTDVNDDNRTTATDALQCINELILGRVSGSELELPLPMPPLTPTPYLDVNGDGLITAVDALRVINRLIEQSSPPQGESIGAEGESLQAEGELVRQAVGITDSSQGESGAAELAADVPLGDELAAWQTTAWGEQQPDDRPPATDESPLKSTQKSEADHVSTMDSGLVHTDWRRS